MHEKLNSSCIFKFGGVENARFIPYVSDRNSPIHGESHPTRMFFFGMDMNLDFARI